MSKFGPHSVPRGKRDWGGKEFGMGGAVGREQQWGLMGWGEVRLYGGRAVCAPPRSQTRYVRDKKLCSGIPPPPPQLLWGEGAAVGSPYGAVSPLWDVTHSTAPQMGDFHQLGHTAVIGGTEGTQRGREVGWGLCGVGRPFSGIGAEAAGISMAQHSIPALLPCDPKQ